MKIRYLLGLLIFFLINSCDSTYHGTANTAGDWYYQKSQIMGGYRITGDHKLTIIRNGPGDYLYKLKVTVRDEMYGGHPKTEYSSGTLESTITNEKWYFSGGDYGERDAYIVINSEYFSENFEPKNLTVRFGTNRGSPINYKR